MSTVVADVATGMRRCGSGVLLLLLPLHAGSAQRPEAALRLARPLGDGAVLQREAPIPVWGRARPRRAVEVSLGGATARTTADDEGRWSVQLPARAAGGPFTLLVVAHGDTARARDVVVGDVWVAAGQSNMEWPLARTTGAAADVAAANDAQLRELKIPIAWAEQPQEELGGGTWERATPQTAGAMSGVAYHVARELRATQRVPIGIINASWGGSAIETWLAAGTQGLTQQGVAARMAGEQRALDSTVAALRARIGTVGERDPGLVDGRARWADPALDDAGWATIEVPALWESQGYAGMDGVAWYRTTFTLTADEAARGATLSLGPIDDDDVTWINAVEVGRTTGYAAPRRYVVPATALRAGRNVLAIRVADGAGGGGPYAAPDSMYLELAGGARRALAGDWKFRVGQLAARVDWQRLNKIPAITYNAMIHPIVRVPVRGFLWYQGESNANDDAQARAYRAQFASLIERWRGAWAPGPSHVLPFLWVQLPGFGRADSTPPASSAWALQREAMEGALSLPATGRAVTIDLGDPDDIHPRNKRDVGHRLALVARQVAYGERVPASGPTLRRHVVEGARIVLELDHVGAGLEARGASGRLGGFAIAGADGRFVWADARIEGDRVLVWSDRVAQPVAVRYAWANNPATANLFNRDGLPAAPFRTDAR